MTDKMLGGAWWLSTMILIAASAGFTMFIAYRGAFETLDGQCVRGGSDLLLSLPIGASCYLICRYRGDLVNTF